MASTYVNDLRLNEMATGDASGSWGTVTNTNLELIAEAFSFGTEGITTNADTHTTTIADGGTDPGRSMFLKYTGTLDSACTITIGPNTVSKLWFIENGTSGSQNIIISQGSGANITIPAGQTKAIYSDGAGSGAAMVDAFATLNVVDLLVDDDLTVTDDLIVGGDIDLEGSIDVNGTANLDVVDIDGAVQIDNTVSVGVDDTGYDVKFFGDTASAYMLWDASADDLILGGAAGLSVNSAALVTGVLTTTAATVFNGGFASNANSTVGGTLITTGNMSISETGADNEKSITIANSSVAGGMIGVEGSSGNRFSGSAVNNMFMGTTTADGIEFATSNTVRANIAADGSASFNGTLTIPSQLIHAGDTDTLFEFQGANSMRFKAGGNEVVEMDGNTVTFNDGSSDYDFRIETNNNTHAIFVDGGNDTVNIGGATNVNGAEVEFTLGSDASAGPYVAVRNNATSLTSDAFARLDIGTYTNNGSNYNASGSYTGKLIFQAQGNDNAYASGSIESYLVTAGNTARSNTTATLLFGCKDATSTSAVEYFRLNGAEQEVVFNETSTSNDFRVESNGDTHALFVDGGNNAVCIGKNSDNNTVAGSSFSNLQSGGHHYFAICNTEGTAGNSTMYINRESADGTLIEFRQANSPEGTISVSGSTVSYNGFAGRHESSGIATSTARGTVVSTIDELDVYPDLQNTPNGGTEANPKAGQPRADHAKVKVSDTSGDACVYGVVAEFTAQGKVIVTSVGIGSIRVTGACAKGDLLESNGDGTAKVQSDDIVRSKTIGKVTIGNSDTGVKLVSCVMYCG